MHQVSRNVADGWSAIN